MAGAKRVRRRARCERRGRRALQRARARRGGVQKERRDRRQRREVGVDGPLLARRGLLRGLRVMAGQGRLSLPAAAGRGERVRGAECVLQCARRAACEPWADRRRNGAGRMRARSRTRTARKKRNHSTRVERRPAHAEGKAGSPRQRLDTHARARQSRERTTYPAAVAETRRRGTAAAAIRARGMELCVARRGVAHGRGHDGHFVSQGLDSGLTRLPQRLRGADEEESHRRGGGGRRERGRGFQ